MNDLSSQTDRGSKDEENSTDYNRVESPVAKNSHNTDLMGKILHFYVSNYLNITGRGQKKHKYRRPFFIHVYIEA